MPVRGAPQPAGGCTREVDERWEVDRQEITLKGKLGAGQYGEVYEGYWTPHRMQVAVKTFKVRITILFMRSTVKV